MSDPFSTDLNLSENAVDKLITENNELRARAEAAERERDLAHVAIGEHEETYMRMEKVFRARAEAAERQVQIEGAAADANGRDARAAEAQRDELVEALESIERAAGAAGAGEVPAMPLAKIARAALAKVRDA